MAFQILQTAQENKQQPYRLNGFLMHSMDSASAVSNGTSKEGNFSAHGDSEEKMNWQCQDFSLQLLDAVQENSMARLSLLEHHWDFQGQELSCVWATGWSQQLTEAKGSRKRWPPWSGPFNSTPQSWWRGGTETGAGSLLPCPEGSCGFRQSCSAVIRKKTKP